MPHDVSIDHPIGCRGRLFHANCRQVQELREDLRRHRLDVPALALREPSTRPRELAVADLLGQRAQRRDRRDDVERRLPLAEAVGLVGDEPLSPRRLGPAAGDRLGDDGLEVVDVVEEAAVEVVDRRVEVARHGQVDAAAADVPSAPASAAATASRVRTWSDALVAETTTSASSSSAPIASSSTACARRRCASSSPCCERPVRDDGDVRPARDEVPRRRLAHLPGAEHEHPPSREIVEDLLRERGGGRRHRRGALADRRLEPHPAAGVQRLPEELVEERAGRARLERGPHLAEDLALAGDERVEAGGDAEEVQRRRLVPQSVERGGEVGAAVAGELGRASRPRAPPRARPGRDRARCGCRWRARPPRPRGARPASRQASRSSATRSRSSIGAL